MAPRISAGILVYRRADRLEVLLAHMGGPFWARRDEAAWTVPKGEVEAGEDPWDAAVREFTEELGTPPPPGTATDLGTIEQSTTKHVRIWAVECPGDFLPGARSVDGGTFELEWPRGSGRIRSYPEVDRIDWFDLPGAERRIVRGQRVALERLADHVGPN